MMADWERWGSGSTSGSFKSAIISPLGDETFSDGRQKVVVYIYMNDEASSVFFCISEDGVLSFLMQA